MKNTITLVMTLALSCLLFGCGQSDSTQTKPPAQSKPAFRYKYERELIRDFAKANYRVVKSIDIQLDVDGSYEVKLIVGDGYKDLGFAAGTFRATADVKAQKVTSWRQYLDR